MKEFMSYKVSLFSFSLLLVVLLLQSAVCQMQDRTIQEQRKLIRQFQGDVHTGGNRG